MSFSNATEAEVLDHVFGLATMTPPALYLAVSRADPTEDGSAADEPTTGGYTRVATTPADWARTDSTVANAVDMTFPEATGPWGELTHFALYDAPSGGSVVMYGSLQEPVEINAADTLRFPAGAVTFTLD